MRHCGHIGRLGEYAERASAGGHDPDHRRSITKAPASTSRRRAALSPGWVPILCVSPCRPRRTWPPSSWISEPVWQPRERFASITLAIAPCLTAGCSIHRDSRPTIHPCSYRSPLGSILPLGGEQSYKGFGLAVILDLLTGGLSGGQCSHPGAPPGARKQCVFPGDCPGSSSREPTDCGARPAIWLITSVQRHEYPGVESILLPGDPERAMLDLRTRQGIPIDLNHWQMLVDLARNKNVPPPTPTEC